MLRIWKRSPVNHRAGGLGSRSRSRICRPRSEQLEDRVVMDAALFPGNPVTLTPQGFSGVGTAAAQTALSQFQAAIGGVKNTAAAPQMGGFRSITWDGVKLDGTDFGGGANTTVVNLNKTIVIPKNRFIGQGVFFGDPYAVSGDGFADVNPNVAGLFTPFSSPNVFAMVNGPNTIDMSFNLPTANNGTPVPAATRGFGAIFLNNELQGSSSAPGSSIEYFSGDKLLGTFYVPAGTQGQAEFLGELFPNAVVTNVTLTLGTDALFSFNGVTSTPGPNANNPAAGHNLVATDDFDFAEPVPLSSLPPILSGPAGTLNAPPVVAGTVGAALPATTVVGTFSDNTAGAVAANYTATINWGDGHIANGAVVADGRGGFNVEGSNTYTVAGLMPISIDIEKLDAVGTSLSLTNTALIAAANTTTTLAVAPGSAQINQPVTLTATVSAAGATPDGGFVEFEDGSTILGVNPVNNGTATLTTTSLAVGGHSLQAVYLGDFNFNGSTSSAVSQTIQVDVTSQFTITLGAIKSRRGKFTQVDTFLNTGGALLGPIALVLQGLSAKVKLLGSSKTTTFFAGSPFVVVTGGTQRTRSITSPFRSEPGSSAPTVARSAAGGWKQAPRVLAGVGFAPEATTTTAPRSPPGAVIVPIRSLR